MHVCECAYACFDLEDAGAIEVHKEIYFSECVLLAMESDGHEKKSSFITYCLQLWSSQCTFLEIQFLLPQKYLIIST